MNLRLTLTQILSIALAVVVLVGITVFSVQRATIYKERAKNASLTAKLYACENAPIHIDTIHDTVVVYSTVHHTPKPKPKPNTNDPGLSAPKGTACDSIYQVFYSDTYSDTEKGIKIHYEILTECDDDSAKVQYVAFPQVVFPKEIVIQTKTIHDTIPRDVPVKLRSKFLLYGGIAANNLESFPALDAGIGYMHKNKWGIIGKAMYVEKKAYGGVGIFVTFGK